MHILDDGSKRPIGFVSTILSVAEKNYAVLQNEALSIVWSISKFSQYLIGQKFKISTDHKPLLSLFKKINVFSK